MPDGGAFADLQKLQGWFTCSVGSASRTAVERLTRRLGAIAVPLLGRELRGACSIRREAAREALAQLANSAARTRVIGELRAIAADAGDDDVKVCALGLLAELGEHAPAHFRDAPAIQRRSALALAAQLATPADVASAADMMVRRLQWNDDDVMQMLEILVDVAPAAAYALATELAMRLDLEVERRERIAALVAEVSPADAGAGKLPRPTQVAVLVDATARVVVVASRRLPSSRRHRRWAVLIGASGCIEDCLHEDDADSSDGDNAPLVASLCADGYRVASGELDHARTVVASAVRRTARAGLALAAAYYLGRDLLDLRDAHVLRPAKAPATTLARAVELLAAGDPAAARALLERTPDPSGAAAGVLAACMLAQGELAAAIAPLELAIAADPAWPLHHWNLAVAHHHLGDAAGCHRATRRFLVTSAVLTGLAADPEQPARLAFAERMLADLERTARITGRPLVIEPAVAATRARRPRARRRKKR